jgi:hypothetical protein
MEDLLRNVKETAVSCDAVQLSIGLTVNLSVQDAIIAAVNDVLGFGEANGTGLTP